MFTVHEKVFLVVCRLHGALSQWTIALHMTERTAGMQGGSRPLPWVWSKALASLSSCRHRRRVSYTLGITYHVADAAHLDMLEDSVVDLVICTMALMDIENAAGAIEEVSRVLRPKGRFVASISHPCFDKMNTSGWIIEQIYPSTTIWRKMSRYREIVVDDLPWKRVPGKVVYTRAYHRPLSWYFRTLRASGLVVAALEEPEPTEELLANDAQAPWIAEIPLHCVREVWKVSLLP